MNKKRTETHQFSGKATQKLNQRAVILLLLFFTSSTWVQAQNDWSQFRGPSRSGVIADAELPDNLPDHDLELLWMIDVGNGFPEVVVSENTAYILSSDSLDGGYEYLAALNADSGKELWKTKVDSMWFEPDGWGHGPRATPVIDKDYIFCLSGHGKLLAVNKNKGKIIWTVSLTKEFGATAPRWGFSASPLLVDDLVILETGGTDGRAFSAFNKKTGEVIWSKANGNASYNSPLIANLNNQTQIIFALDTMLYAYNSKGEELWNFRMPLGGPMAMPVFISPNKIFVSSVSRKGSFIVEVNDNEAKEILTSTTMQNNWSSSCYRDGYLYGFSKAKLQCVSAETGEMIWGKRGFGKGSLIIVGDKLLALSDQGKLIVAEATPDAYKEIGTFQVLEGKSWTAPAWVDGKLYVRNLSKMACYKLSK